jgi:hypothetical protein
MVLDDAYRELEAEIPTWLAQWIARLRSPGAQWVRLPLAILLIAGSLLWFLPILGIEMLPLGLLLLAEDIPFLRTPVGKVIIWLIEKWRALRRWWRGESRK